MKTKSILIVGGGTSGLVSALMLKTAFKNAKIDLIESSEIGIVGVGEGSTEHWDSFMRFCGITKQELVQEAGATFKYGINFIDWNGDKKNYFHAVNGEYNQIGVNRIQYMYLYLISQGVDPLEMQGSYVADSLLPENNYNINQFHFDTFKLNKFLHKKCKELGINIIDDTLESVSLDENGFITSVNSGSKKSYAYDFFIDSSGFSKFILGKSYGINWRSYQKYLPMNAAIAFPTETTPDIPAWTTARAMTAGWSWRIPTQERYGNGYVFNDAFMTADAAKQEMEELYGHEISIAKNLKFDAGRMEKIWHKNCVGIGLSTLFVEPLEATSIGTTIQQIFLLIEKLPSFIPGNISAESTYNKSIEEIFDNILDFIALHYRVKRCDTEFWRSIDEVPIPPGLENLLEVYRYKTPTDYDFQNNKSLFKAANWIMVMHGLELVDKTLAYQDLEYLSELEKNMLPYRVPNFDGIKFISHRQSIENLKNTK